MDFVANQRYQSIRKQLDSLHYCQPFNIESSALVERLLTDLLKTTEAYQKTKNDLALITHENKLNQQSLLPFQKENERLAKENNSIHMDIIRTKEELGQVELKWKSSMRQLQNESQDLKFLVEQKDLRILKQDGELNKLKSKMEKVLTKAYGTQANEITEGQREFTEQNNLKGTQEFEITHPLSKHHNDMSEVMRDQSFTYDRAGTRDEFDRKNKQWVEEIRKADERCDHYRQESEQMRKRKTELEERLQQIEKQVYTREEEIKRLHNLYEGGQNLEKMNMRYIQETNEKIVNKLENQIDFLNKENQKVSQQVSILRGDKTVVDEMGELKKEIDELSFANQTLRKDLSESTKLIKGYQEKEFYAKRKSDEQEVEEEQKQTELEQKFQQLSNENDKLKSELERINQLRAAYNADKSAFNNKVGELEQKISSKEKDKEDLQERLTMNVQAAQQYKNEINFLNGKCTTLKRDLEYQERYMTKFKEENVKLQDQNEMFKRQMDMKEREQSLLQKQVSGLQEDNERINRLYQVVEREAFTGKPIMQENKFIAQKGKEGGQDKWKNVDDEFGTFGKRDKVKVGSPSSHDMKTTVKRSTYI